MATDDFRSQFEREALDGAAQIRPPAGSIDAPLKLLFLQKER